MIELGIQNFIIKKNESKRPIANSLGRGIKHLLDIMNDDFIKDLNFGLEYEKKAQELIKKKFDTTIIKECNKIE
jgi:hypothetical protein